MALCEQWGVATATKSPRENSFRLRRMSKRIGWPGVAAVDKVCRAALNPPQNMDLMDSIQKALESLRRGEREQALGQLAEALKVDPQNGRAWAAMAAVHPEIQRKRYCLERAIALDPGLDLARQALARLNMSGAKASGLVEQMLLDRLAPLEAPPAPPSPSASGGSGNWLDTLRPGEPASSPPPGQPDETSDGEEADWGVVWDVPLSQQTSAAPPADKPGAGNWLDTLRGSDEADVLPEIGDSPAAEDIDWNARLGAPAGRPAEAAQPFIPDEEEPAAPIDWTASLRGEFLDPEPAVEPAWPETEPDPEEANTDYVFESLGQRVANAQVVEQARSQPAGRDRSARPASPPKRNNPPAARRRTWLGSCLVVLLAVVLFGVLSLGALIGLQMAGALPLIPGLPNFGLVEPTATPAPLVIVDTPTPFVLPPTWTPTPAQIPSITPSPTPRNAMVLPSSTPAASFTPLPPGLVYTVGRSVNGENMQLYRFGTGKQSRLLVMGIHGGEERFTAELANQLITNLQQDPNQVPPHITLYILPVLNPDGVLLEDDPAGRLNAHNIDLDRNFTVNWASTWDATNCAVPSGSGGDRAASEPETQAFMQVIRSRAIEMLINVQGGATGVYPANREDGRADLESYRLGQNVSRASGLAFDPRRQCPATGRLVDWAVENGAWSAVDLRLANNNQAIRTVRSVLDALYALSLPSPTPGPIPTLGTGTPAPGLVTTP